VADRDDQPLPDGELAARIPPPGVAGQARPARVRTGHGRVPQPRVHTATLEAMADDVLLVPVATAFRRRLDMRELSERVAFGKAMWRELVIGFAAQLGELNLGFTQLAALYALLDGGTTTIAELADLVNRSPSATSRMVDGLERRRLVERRHDPDDGRIRTVWLTERGRALLGVIDRARADEFLAVVRPLPPAERAIVAMGVAALSTRAVSRRGRLIKQPAP
jgi:DNA-binding MarR family transcriptional regulator